MPGAGRETATDGPRSGSTPGAAPQAVLHGGNQEAGAGTTSFATSAARAERARRYNPPMATEADQERFRAVFGHFPTGVAVITYLAPDGPGGMTASAVCSLSLDPLLVLVCFDNAARTLPFVRELGRFAVNVLTADQHDAAAVFASKRPEREKFVGVEHSVHADVPILDGALAWVVCDLRELLPGGDHTIGIGAVAAMGDADGAPLVFYQGAYHRLGSR